MTALSVTLAILVAPLTPRAGADVPRLTVNSCEELLAKPESWPHDAVDRAVGIVTWIYRVHPEYTRAMNLATTPQDFAALYFAAVGHGVPPVNYSPLGNLFYTNHLQKLHRAAIVESRDLENALLRDAQRINGGRMPDADRNLFALELVKSVRGFARHLAATADPPEGALRYRVRNAFIRQDVSPTFEAILAKCRPLLAPLEDRAIFALVYGAVRERSTLLVDTRFELDERFNADFRIEALQRVAAEENTAPVHKMLGGFKQRRRDEFNVVRDAFDRAGDVAPARLDGPSAVPALPPPSTLDPAPLERFLTAPVPWVDPAVALDVNHAIEFDRGLEHALHFINEIQAHAVTLLTDEVPWDVLRDAYGPKRDPRALTPLLREFAARNAAALRELTRARETIVDVNAWITRQSDAFAQLDKSEAALAKLDVMAQNSLGHAIARLEVLPTLGLGTQRAFEVRLKRINEESMTLGTLSVLVATRLQNILAGEKFDPADDPLMAALSALAPDVELIHPSGLPL